MLQVFLIVSILAGELIKFPLSGNQGPVALDILVSILCLIGIYKVKLKFKKPNSPIKIGFLFILVAILSLAFTPLHLNLNEYLTSFSYTTRFFLYLILSYLIYLGAFPGVKKKISQTLLFSGVGLSAIGLLQFVIFPNLEFLQVFGWDPHYFRTVSTFLDPNFAGAFFVLTILILTSYRTSRVYYLAFVITYLALLTTFSRSSYLMFLVSGVALSLLKKSKALFLSTLLLFLILLLGFQIYGQFVAIPKGVNRTQSASYRLDAWQDGITIFQKSPILGIGFNAYKYAVSEYRLADEQFLDSRGSTTNDSSFLYILATTGLLGLITYTLFLISIISSAFKNNFVLVAGVAGLIVHSFFANSLFYPFILIWILLAVYIKD